MVTSAILSLILAGSTALPPQTQAPARQLEPVPLRQLCDSADLVAVVRAGKSWERKNAGPLAIGTPFLAELEVLETLKGQTEENSIKVCFQKDVLSGATGQFAKGKTQLVFLTQLADELYEASAGNKGCMEMSGLASLNAHTSAVRNYFELQNVDSRLKRHALTVDWLVSLAENPHTRLHGAAELNLDRQRCRAQSLSYRPSTVKPLTAEQTERLIVALCDSKEFSKANQSLFRVLQNEDDSRLKNHLLIWISGWRSTIPWKSGYFLNQAVRRSGNPAAMELFNRKWVEFERTEGGKDWNFIESHKKEAGAVKEILRLMSSPQAS